MEAERQRLINLQRNISKVVDQMEQEIRTNKLIPQNIVLTLIQKLRTLGKVTDPQRPLVCYVVGNTNTGKSALINKLCGYNACNVSEDDMHGTTTFSQVHVPKLNADFVDTIGFGFHDDTVLSKQIETRFNETLESPDVILLVITKENIRDQAALIRITHILNSILKWLKEQRHRIEVPVVCVLNKIDEYLQGVVPQEQHAEKIDAYLTNALNKVNEHLCTEVTQRVAVSSWHNYNVDHLLSILNVNSPLNAQIIQNNHQYFLEYRRSMANKIITSFTLANAAISILPVIDIPIITIMEGWMFKMLACFSVDPERTADTFSLATSVTNSLWFAVRAGFLLLGDGLEVTGVAYAAGVGLSAATASITTAKFGWACYNYFTK